MKWRWYRPGDEHRLDHVPDGFPRALIWLFDGIERYFRYEVQGLERIPRAGGGLLITPHSFLTIDGFLLAKAIFERLGRIVRGLSDHHIFRVPLVREAFLALGVVDGTPENAVGLLRRGELCFAMPGGGDEAFRSSAERYQLRWEGHHGYLRVALRAGVPLIPAVCIGADDAYWMPLDGMYWGRRLLGVRLPIAIPVGLGPLPLPVKLTSYVGEPIRLPADPALADDFGAVEALHGQVMATIRRLLEDGLRRRSSLWR